jgi:hypothetical protein
MVLTKYLTHFDALILMGMKIWDKKNYIKDYVFFILSVTKRKIGIFNWSLQLNLSYKRHL